MTKGKFPPVSEKCHPSTRGDFFGGSKFLIYLSLLFFLEDYFILVLVRNVSDARGKKARSNKSVLLNHLSYRCVPDIFQGKSRLFRVNKALSK